MWGQHGTKRRITRRKELASTARGCEAIESGAAYYCPCTRKKSNGKGQSAAEKRPPGTRRCRKIERAEASRSKTAGEAAAVVCRAESGSTVFEDAVFGKVEPRTPRLKISSPAVRRQSTLPPERRGRRH